MKKLKKINKKISVKYFYHKLSPRLKNREYMFKYIKLSFNRWENGNAEIFIHFFNLNFIIYINGLKENKKVYKSVIRY